MLSIYNNKTTEKLCKEFCEGFVDENGNTIRGMVNWVEERKTQYLETHFNKQRNIKYSKEINELNHLLTKDTIRKILKGKPNELINLWNTTFNKYKGTLIRVIDDKNKKTYKNVNLISLLFNYNSFRKISVKNKYSGFILAKKLGIECCPYCNRNYTTSHVTLENKKVFPEFDHFYHKGSYPLFAVSFYNLIPSCNVCNTHFKGSKDSITEQLFHPYTELTPKAFNFSFIPEDVQSLYGKKDNFELNFIINDQKNKNNLENSLEFFGIKDIYELCHTDLIKEIINKKLSYSNKYLEIIKDTYGISFEESYRILFETYYEDDKLHERPFSKLKKDIFEDVNII